jgi:hypothetical protein
MRLPEHEIKGAILHPDPEIRDRAVSYFAKSFSSDPGIMPLVIEAVETHGKRDAYRLIGLARDLPQSEATVAWVVRELNDPQTDQYENYAYNLSMVLAEADTALLLPNESAVTEARHFSPGLRATFTERLRMASWDETTCWQRLEEFCEEAKDDRYTTDVDLGHARRIVEALARKGGDCEGRVRDILSEKVQDDHSPLKWMGPLAVRLAGQARLESAVPLIVGKLLEDGGDLLNEECAEALTRIGTPAVLDAVAEAFPSAEHHYRLYATSPLERIHSDLAMEKCLRLLGREKEEDIRQNLAHALLCHFAHEGIEAARKMLIGRNYLLETCKLMGERFPEYDEWLAVEEAEADEHRRRMKELEGDPKGMLLFALEKLTGQKPADVRRPRPALPPAPRLTQPRKPEAVQKVGRNDPCPCRSGKKFKNGCMTKQRGH